AEHRHVVRPLSECLRTRRFDAEGGLRMIHDPFERREIWVLTGTQDLYGEDVLDQVAEHSRALVATLRDAQSLPGTIRWQPILREREGSRRMAHEATADEACIRVIAWMHTFSPAKSWIQGLSALQKPLLHLHTQANVELPWAEIDMDFMNLNQAAHGDREFGYIATRLGIA